MYFTSYPKQNASIYTIKTEDQLRDLRVEALDYVFHFLIKNQNASIYTIKTEEPQLRELRVEALDFNSHFLNQNQNASIYTIKTEEPQLRNLRVEALDWSRRQDLNLRHLAPKASTLPN